MLDVCSVQVHSFHLFSDVHSPVRVTHLIGFLGNYRFSCKTLVARQRSPSPELSRLLQEEVFCDEFHLVDLRVYENCKKVVKGCDHVFNLAADMGGKLDFQIAYPGWLAEC